MPKTCMYEAAILMHDALMHHGIKNQHWGVRNGPPYPLDKKTSARIKRGDNEKARVSAKEYRDMRSGKIKTTAKDKVGISHRTAKWESKWVEGVKASDLPFTDNVANLISYGMLGHIRRLKRPGHRATMDDCIDTNWQSRVDSPGNANNKRDEGLFNNCAMCTATMALRSLGWDVQAGRSAHGSMISALQYWFDGARPYKEKSVDSIERRIMSFGRHGKCGISLRRANGAGHSAYCQVERDPNTGQHKPVVYDGQTGTKWGSIGEFLRAEGADLSQFTTITRLDDATPNFGHLGEDSVVRMNYTNEDMNVIYNPNTSKWQSANSVRFT